MNQTRSVFENCFPSGVRPTLWEIVAGYVDRIGTKYTAKWGVQMAGMNFQTRSGAAFLPKQV